MGSTIKLGLVLVAVVAVAGAAFLLLGDDGGDGAGGAAVVSQDASGDAGSYDGVDRTRMDDTEDQIESLRGGVAPAPLVDSGSPAAKQDEPRLEARLTGQVVDEAGRGVLGAKVTFLDKDQSMLMRFRVSEDDAEIDRPSVTTNGQGRFDLTALFDQRAEDGDEMPSFLRADDLLVVTHEAFATAAQELDGLSPGERDIGTIVVGAGAEIYGRVVDENGRPLDEATVSGQNLQEQGGRGFRTFRIGNSVIDSFNQVVTESDGRFRLTGLKPGDASLSARRNDRRMGYVDELELIVGVPVDVGDVVLEPGSSIAGTVVDKQGRPVAGANIRVSSMTRIMASRAEDMPRSTIGHEFQLRAETDRNGWFEISGLGLGTYTVHAWGDAFPAVQRENVPTGTKDLVLEIATYGSVLVTLSNSRDGAMVAGATIDLGGDPGGFGRGGRGAEEVDERTVVSGQALADQLELELEDVAGQYLIPGIGNEGLEIGILAEGFGAQTVTTPAAASGKIVPFEVTLQPESIVRGRVLTARGDPVHDAVVSMTRSEDDGDVFELGNGQVRREVRRGFRIGGSELATRTLTARTDRNGVFEVLGASEGRWDVGAEAQGWVDSESAPVVLGVGAEVTGVELTLLRGGSIAGTVLDADGIPLGDVTVVVSKAEAAGGGGGVEDALQRELASMFGGGGDNRRATTDNDGDYQIDDLLPGPYKVSLGRVPGGMRMGGGAMFMLSDGSAPRDDTSVFVVVEAGSIAAADLTRPRSATITGEVMAGGRAVEGAMVQLSRASAAGNIFGGRGLRGFGGGRSVETDRFGMYAFDDVDAGDYDVSTIVPGAALSKEVSVSVEAGGRGRADLTFGGSTLVGRVVDEDTGDGVPGVLVTASPAGGSSVGGGNVQMSFQIVTAGRGPGGSGMSMDLRGGSESTVRTAPDGSFEILYVEPGRYELGTAEGSHVPGNLGPLEIADGGEYDDLLITVARGAAVEGRVFSGETGLAMAGVPVRLSGPEGTEMSTTGPDGGYAFEGLVEGAYTAEVLGSGFGGAPIATEDVELVKGETQQLDMTTDPEASTQDGGGMTFQIGG